MRFFFLLILGFVFFSCTDKDKKIISSSEMKVILWDMTCADELANQMAVKDSTLKKKKQNIKLYEQVFAVHNITKEAFYNSFAYYEAHPDQYKILLDSVTAYGKREKIKAEPKSK